eukprot:322561-Chlamydomonas_euryale.AAC.4
MKGSRSAYASPAAGATLTCMRPLEQSLVKQFFNEKEVISTLVMDALFSGCRQIEEHSRHWLEVREAFGVWGGVAARYEKRGEMGGGAMAPLP